MTFTQKHQQPECSTQMYAEFTKTFVFKKNSKPSEPPYDFVNLFFLFNKLENARNARILQDKCFENDLR